MSDKIRSLRPDWCSIADEIAQLKATFPNLLVPPSCSDSFLRCLTIKCRFIRITCWLIQVNNIHWLHHGYMFRYILRKTPLFRLTCHVTLETTVWLLPTKREKYSRGKVEFFIATSCNTLQNKCNAWFFFSSSSSSKLSLYVCMFRRMRNRRCKFESNRAKFPET